MSNFKKIAAVIAAVVLIFIIFMFLSGKATEWLTAAVNWLLRNFTGTGGMDDLTFS